MSKEEVVEFMASREASPSVLAALRDEKIDVETVLQVDDQSLSQFIPKLGDRVALRTHCSKIVQKSKKKDTKRSELFEALKMKLARESHKKPPEKDSETRKSDWRMKTRKETRKIEFGWIHDDHQVRKRYGGGVRKMDVKRSFCRNELLEIAKELFFPGGKSSKGSLNDVTCDLLDFKQNTLPNGQSVSDCYDLYKIGILTVYLHTKSRASISVNAQDDQHGLSEGTGQATISNDAILQNVPEILEEQWVTVKTSSPAPVNEIVQDTVEASSEARNDILQEAVEAIGSFDEELPDLNFGNLPEFEVTENNHNNTVPLPTESIIPLSTVQMTIHRGSLAFAEVIGYFKDADILNKVVNVVRILPNGKEEMAEDTGGVLRDTITEFWHHFYSQFTIGRNVKVPSLRHDFGVEEWKAVGRVLLFGWKRLNYWPLKMSKIFILQCLFPGRDPEPSMLMEDFHEFATAMDSDNFKHAVEDFTSVEDDDLLESLETYNCRTKVDSSNLVPVLFEIANLKLIQETMYIVECWREIFSTLSVSEEQLMSMYSSKRPTNRSVVQLLELPEASNVNERQAGKFLKQYVKEMDPEKLQKFLRFCTGSDMINTEKIQVTFIPMEYFERRPIAHTCGTVLKLSNNYSNYMEFRAEFDNVLSSNVWVMDII